MAGNYILSVACMMLSRIQNDDVTLTISQVNHLIGFLAQFFKFVTACVIDP